MICLVTLKALCSFAVWDFPTVLSLVFLTAWDMPGRRGNLMLYTDYRNTPPDHFVSPGFMMIDHS